MKQTVQPDASQTQKTADPARSRPSQQYAAASGCNLAQLAAMVNSSARVQALTQMKEDIQRSARVQSLQQLSPAQLSERARSPIAPGEAAQLKIGIAGTLAHSDRVAGQDNPMEDHGSSTAESPSACGCSAKQEAAPKREQSPAQKKSNGEQAVPAQFEEKPAPAPNRTGLPDRLKAGVENLAGISLDDVKVHYNSEKPAQLNALAYAQGTAIHVAPGQEKHLPHEAWHIVQQKEGRVRPTMQMKQGVPVNDNKALEHEADVMGAKALSAGNSESPQCFTTLPNFSASIPIQRMRWRWRISTKSWEPIDSSSSTEVLQQPEWEGTWDGEIFDDAAEEKNQPVESARDLLMRAFEDVKLPRGWGKNPKKKAIINLLLDLGAEQIRQWGNDAALTLPTFLANPLAYTSCHNTAVSLVNRFNATPTDISPYRGLDKDKAKQQTNGIWLNLVSRALQTGIANDIKESQRSIYEVQCGGHGFAILVRYGKAEILQSFANAISLLDRMEMGALVFNADEIQKLVLNLASKIESERDEAANLIASCNAEVFGLTPYPCFQYIWRRQPLLSDEEIVQFFKADLEAALKALEPYLKAAKSFLWT